MPPAKPARFSSPQRVRRRLHRLVLCRGAFGQREAVRGRRPIPTQAGQSRDGRCSRRSGAGGDAAFTGAFTFNLIPTGNRPGEFANIDPTRASGSSSVDRTRFAANSVAAFRRSRPNRERHDSLTCPQSPSLFSQNVQALSPAAGGGRRI